MFGQDTLGDGSHRWIVMVASSANWTSTMNNLHINTIGYYPYIEDSYGSEYTTGSFDEQTEILIPSSGRQRL